MLLRVAVNPGSIKYMPWLTVSLEKRLLFRNRSTMWQWMIDFWATPRFQIRLLDVYNMTNFKLKLKQTMRKYSKPMFALVAMPDGNRETKTKKLKKFSHPNLNSKASLVPQISFLHRRHRFLKLSQKMSQIWSGVSQTCSWLLNSSFKTNPFLKSTILITSLRLKKRRTRRMRVA